MYLYGHRKTLLTEIPRDKITTRTIRVSVPSSSSKNSNSTSSSSKKNSTSHNSSHSTTKKKKQRIKSKIKLLSNTVNIHSIKRLIYSHVYRHKLTTALVGITQLVHKH